MAYGTLHTEAGYLQRVVEELVRTEATLLVDDFDGLNRCYLRSYPEFILFFSRATALTVHHTILGANISFAWMPTIPRLRLELLTTVTALLNQARTRGVLKLEEFCTIQQFMNSTVAASKLLHFLVPSVYPIWDGNVLDYLRNVDRSFPANSNLPASYLRFLALCRELAGDVRIDRLRASLSEKMGYSITHCRAIEFTMFAARHGRVAADPTV